MEINWGMIGCGDVTELKSGPAFSKINNSKLVAVMSRNPERAKDYSARHNVPTWYDDASKLINDPGVNAIYIATPPSSHERYALEAIHAGKNVYIEKPMALNAASAGKICEAAINKNVKLTVAHYRRGLSLFRTVKEWIGEGRIGNPLYVRLQYFRKPHTSEELAQPKTAWRLNKEISGGGLFHDLAPHQLDLILWFFGKPRSIAGFSHSQGSVAEIEDIVSGTILFENDVLFDGTWRFNSRPEDEKDECAIYGTEGSISFQIFGEAKVELRSGEEIKTFGFETPQHIQQPMIEMTVRYFLGESDNPCSATDGVKVMKMIDRFTKPEQIDKK